MLFVLFAFSANANVEPKDTPMDSFISDQIEALELEIELFGTPLNDGILNVQSIKVCEVLEEVNFAYDTSEYLPLNFDVNDGKNLDWTNIELLEEEEDVEFNFNVKEHLPSDFNAYFGMTPLKSQGICLK